jgi:uncharacterized protein
METKKKQGLATMSQERRREIAQLGGRAAHHSGRAHKWTSEEAREAGRKGGTISRPPRKPDALADVSRRRRKPHTQG